MNFVYKIKVKSQFLQGGKCVPSFFFIFFFDKNISDGFQVQDCIHGVKTALSTRISDFSDHFGCYGHMAILAIIAILAIMAIITISAIMITLARYGCLKKRLDSRNIVLNFKPV